MNVEIIGNGNITSKNFNASFLINDSILIDTPPGILKELKRLEKNINDIKIIIITHLHGDHYFDLPFIILNEHIRERTENLIIIGPKELKKQLAKLTYLAFNNRLNKYLVNLNITFIDALTVQNNEIAEELYLNSIKVEHGNLRNCYGFLFTKKDKVLGVTGDTEMCPGLTYMLKKASHILIDVNANVKGKHLNLSQFKELVNEYQINYIPVHFPDEIESELSKIKNVKIIKPEEQFFI